VQNLRKFSAVLGVTSANSSIFMRPSGSPIATVSYGIMVDRDLNMIDRDNLNMLTSMSRGHNGWVQVITPSHSGIS
jgi:hypothetical protein